MQAKPYRESVLIRNDGVTVSNNNSSDESLHGMDIPLDNSHTTDNMEVAASGNRPSRQKREPSWLQGDEWEK